MAGSSMVFIVAMNSALLGLLAAITTGLSVWEGARRFFAFWKTYEPRYPSPVE